MGALLRLLMRQGLHRGLLGGSRAWVIIGGIGVLGHLARKGLTRDEDILWSGEVAPGQVVTVRHEPDPRSPTPEPAPDPNP